MTDFIIILIIVAFLVGITVAILYNTELRYFGIYIAIFAIVLLSYLILRHNKKRHLVN